MFRQARLKLTAWYLLIIVVICLFFTVPTYKLLTREVDRFSRAQRFRLESGSKVERLIQPPLSEDLILETKQRVISQLGILNLVIVLISGGLSYFLAGKTLLPIKVMMEEQNRFVSDSSHELRTPITSLKTAIEVALKDKESTKQELQEVLKDNLTDINRLSALSESLLQLSQNNPKNSPLAVEAINLKALTEESISSLKNVFQSKNIKLQNKVKNLNVNTSQKTLHEILVIILDNACKYSSENSIVVISSKVAKEYVYLSVADHGLGIKSKELNLIFDRFFRADDARSSLNSNGYGLGLSIAKELAKQINAQILVESTYQKGSTFTVKLPNSFS